MEQSYWLSPVLADGRTRQLLWRYGAGLYEGTLLTEPVSDVASLPRVLQGIQAAQGRVPFLCALADVPPHSAAAASLRALDAALAGMRAAAAAAEPRIAELVDAGAAWLDGDAATVLEFEAQPGHTCGGAELVFAWSHGRGGLLLSCVYFGGRYLATLAPATAAEQALVDTAMPAILGRRRGAAIARYAPPPALLRAPAYDGQRGVDDVLREMGGDKALLPPWMLFQALSVWEVGEPAPAASACVGGGGGGGSARADAGAAAALADGGLADTVDLTDGTYTQIYVLMEDDGAAGAAAAAGRLTAPRRALFRFGDWLYGGDIDFAVGPLRQGDVPTVLPALQRQQGGLAFLCEARACPAGTPATALLAAFAAAVRLLRAEIDAAAEALAALAEDALTAWVDAEWAASFLELALQPASLPPALAGVAVIAAKLYLAGGAGGAGGAGVTMHVVLHGASLFCVLSDAAAAGDLPLLDVAFPDITARNRAAQVRAYSASAARAAAAPHGPMTPLPAALRVWEGRRRGVPGVGCGAADALAAAAATGADAAAAQLRARARCRGEAAEVATAAAAAAAATAAAAASQRAASAGAAAVAPAAAGAVFRHEEGTAAEDALADDDVDGIAEWCHASSGSGGGSGLSDVGRGAAATLLRRGPTALLAGSPRAYHLAPLASTAGHRKLSPAAAAAAAATAAAAAGSAPWLSDGRPKVLLP